jgi:hypothetical protein
LTNDTADCPFRYKDADYGLATQRNCLALPPSDGKQRCAYVKLKQKEVYMCFCKGDLCNGADKAATNSGVMAVVALLSLLLRSGVILSSTRTLLSLVSACALEDFFDI